MPHTPRITADFNYGGRAGDEGVVYLKEETLRQIEDAGVELEEGTRLMLSDYDGTAEEPTWLVAEGVVSFDAALDQWTFRYGKESTRWEVRLSGE